MQRILVCSGVLGLGTALVFGAAALTATLFPNGTMVSAGWNGGMWDRGWGVAVPMPMPGMPAVAVEPAIGIDEGPIEITVDGEDNAAEAVEVPTPAP